jgi:hypothetical protein
MEDNIERFLTEIAWAGVDWIHLFQIRTGGRREKMLPRLKWLCPVVLVGCLLTNLNSDCFENRPGKIRKDKRHKTVVVIATRYELVGQEIESRWGGEIFRTRPDRPWDPPSLLYNGYRVFSGVEASGAWRWPPIPSSTEVKERVELYLYSLSGPILGWTWPLTLESIFILQPTFFGTVPRITVHSVINRLNGHQSFWH